MRPIPAQRIGHAHGLLKALDQRGKLRLEEFVTEFTEQELFPPDLDGGAGRTRQFVSYARAAGLVKEERGSVELTDLGKRYVKSADKRDIFRVSHGQAEWLRRQLREKHLTESIWNGAAIALSLYNSLPEGDWVAVTDVGRSAAHLGRAGWDNEQTFQAQGERLTLLLQDMQLISEERSLTDIGRETIGELRLPLHAGLKDLAAQLHPDGADGAAAAAAAEREELGLGPAPDAETAAAAADPPPDQDIDAPDDDPGQTGEWVDVGPAAEASAPPAAVADAAAAEPAAVPEAEAAADPPAKPDAEAAADPPAVSEAEAEPAAEAVAESAAVPDGEAAAEPPAEQEAAAEPPAAPDVEVAAAPTPESKPPAPADAEVAAEPAPDPEPPAAPKRKLGPIEAAALAAAGGGGGEDLAGPDDATRSYPALTGSAGSSVAEDAAPAITTDPPAPDAPAETEEAAPAGVAAAAAAEAAAKEATPEVEETAMNVPDDPGSESGGQSFQSGIRPTTAITAIRPEDLANWKATQEAAEAEKAKDEPDKGTGPFLDPAVVREAAERRGLVIDPGVYAAAIAALASGRHLVLTGGAGSGKTALALAIAEAAVRQGRCKSVLFTSAIGADDALGHYDGGKFKGGLVPTAIGDDKWLVVDELDRVSLDDEFGSVSTVLGGSPIDLPGGGELKSPAGWRMIATMADIDQVGMTSQALRRRFVFIELPVLERADLETLVGAWAGDDEVAAAVGKRLVAINDVVPLGPGLYRDAVAYVKARGSLNPASEDDLLLEALAGFVLPQLEGGDDEIAGAAVRAAGFTG